MAAGDGVPGAGPGGRLSENLARAAGTRLEPARDPRGDRPCERPVAGGPDRGLPEGRRRVRARAGGGSLGRAGELGDDVQPRDRAGTPVGNLTGPRGAARVDRPMVAVAEGHAMNNAATTPPVTA